MMTHRTEELSREQSSTYELWKQAQEKTYLGAWPTSLQVAFVGCLVVNRESVCQELGVGSMAMFAVLIVLLWVTAAMAMSVSSVVCYQVTGIVYTKDRRKFALVGGFDVGRAPILAVQAGLYGLFHWTAPLTNDPIPTLRGPWVFLLWATSLGFVLTAVVGYFVFTHHDNYQAKGR